jgi:membrane fusion protein, multidrug efflux system
LTIAVLLGVVALGGYFGWRHYAERTEPTAPGAANKPDPQSRAIPVTVAPVQTADFPVILNGLGTVEPYNTITVRSRVDGEVIKVAFKQGQMVKDGDILVQIDPRPYQAALDQVLAKKTEDEANLKDAQANLQRYSTLAKEDFA